MLSAGSSRSALGAGRLVSDPEAISLTCSDGIVLTGQSYQNYPHNSSSKHTKTTNAPSSSLLASSSSYPRRRRRRILCLHGWMDNCRSYYYFAPHLLEKLTTTKQMKQKNANDHEEDDDNDDSCTDDDHVHLVALDFPGHGQSSHFGPGRPGMVLAELIVYVAEALRALGWTTHHGNNGSNRGGGGDGTIVDTATATTTIVPTKNITLVGHSMGAAVACLYAAAFPEQIEQLVLLEGVGPMARPALDAAKHVRKHVEKRLLSHTLYAEPRKYDTLALAVAARCRTARTWPGHQYLSEVAAQQLVEYGTIKKMATTATAAAATATTVNHNHVMTTTTTTNSNDNDDGTTATSTTAPYYYQFRHDPRLQWPSLQFFTQEQTDGVYRDIQCPTALILAADGWPFDESTRRHTMELLRPVHTVTLPGSHHWHMDPDTASAVVEQVAQFLRSRSLSI